MGNIKGVREMDFLKGLTIKDKYKERADEKRKECELKIGELDSEYSDVLEEYKKALEEFRKVEDVFKKAVDEFNDKWKPLLANHKKERNKIVKQYEQEVKSLQRQLKVELQEL